ncbi:hypothetical protein MRB53_006133 [Persea americana]|uniref:Uncharacterized protein n=1 Tax=Persea americana TaxID=3435 RepID=A0ACC2MFF2_PERAE|nr:hypothetical protein MRB53_006133 [Persea americana]
MGFSAASVVGEAAMAMWRCKMATVWSAWSEKLAMATVWSEERGDVFSSKCWCQERGTRALFRSSDVNPPLNSSQRIGVIDNAILPKRSVQEGAKSSVEAIGGSFLSSKHILVSRDIVRRNTRWLANSLAVTVRWEGAIPGIRNLFQSHGLELNNIARLGGGSVLVSFEEFDSAWKVINHSDTKFSKFFFSLERWRPRACQAGRIVWVRCFGVPLLGWQEETFCNIGERLGEVVGVAKETVEKSFLEYGRVCVWVKGHRFIYEEFSLLIFGNTFLVKVSEECVSLAPRCSQEKKGEQGTRAEDLFIQVEDGECLEWANSWNGKVAKGARIGTRHHCSREESCASWPSPGQAARRRRWDDDVEASHALEEATTVDKGKAVSFVKSGRLELQVPSGRDFEFIPLEVGVEDRLDLQAEIYGRIRKEGGLVKLRQVDESIKDRDDSWIDQPSLGLDHCAGLGSSKVHRLGSSCSRADRVLDITKPKYAKFGPDTFFSSGAHSLKAIAVGSLCPSYKVSKDVSRVIVAKIRVVWGSKKRGGVAHFRRVVALSAGMALTAVLEEGRGRNALQRVYSKDGLIELLPEQEKVDPDQGKEDGQAKGILEAVEKPSVAVLRCWRAWMLLSWARNWVFSSKTMSRSLGR